MDDPEEVKRVMLEMIDDLRAKVAEGKVSGFAFAAHIAETNMVIVGSKAMQVVTILGGVELLRANIVNEIQSSAFTVPPSSEHKN